MKNEALVLGIDLGTTYSGSSMADQAGIPRPNKQRDGSYMVPSVLNINGGKVIIGVEAENLSVFDPENTVLHPKREMAVDTPDGSPPVVHIDSDGKQTSAVEACAHILQAIRENAEAVSNRPITSAVVSVPACANEAQRQRTKDAARLAGFEEVFIVDEPVAAALAAGVSDELRAGQRLLAVDIGGGTSDVVLITKDANGDLTASSASGREDVAGNEYDGVMMDILTARLMEEGISKETLEDPSMRHHLLDHARKAKHALSGTESTSIALFIDGKKVALGLTRAEFESATQSITDSIMEIVDRVLSENDVTAQEVDIVVPLGGSSRIPAIRAGLEQRFTDVRTAEDPDMLVAMGCALAHGKLLKAQGKTIQALDGTPIQSLPGGDFKTCAGFSLGCRAFDRTSTVAQFTEIIGKNSTLPASNTQEFAIRERGQTQVDVCVLQGAPGQHPDDCLLIDTLYLTDLPPEDGDGRARIEVTYEYKADGLVVVTAADKESGKSVTTDITRYISTPTA